MTRWPLLLLGLLASPLAAEVDPFADAQDVTVESGPSLLTTVDATRPLVIGGKTKISAGAFAGWLSWRDAEHGEGILLEQALTFDAKPLRNFSMHSEFEISYPYSSSGLRLSELYVDATVFDVGYLRIGKVTTSWGSAKIFNIVDLASDSESGLSVKASLPWTGGSVTSLMTLPSMNWDAGDVTEMDYGFHAWDDATQAFRLSLVGSGYDAHAEWRHRNYDAELATPSNELGAGLKLIVAGVDVFCDVLAQGGRAHPRFSAVGGVFTEWSLGTKAKLQLYGEYQYDRRDVTVPPQHQTSVALKATDLGSNKVELGVQWSSSWNDGTNEILLGSAFDPEDGLRIKLGVPLQFGINGRPGVYYAPGQDYLLAAGCKIEATLVY